MKILVLNGPNLARLDLREKSIYGDFSYVELEQSVTGFAKDAGVTVEIMQSDSETELIQILHKAADSKTSVIFNPAAFTHYSYAIRDAVVMLKAPIIEVHISNPLSREEFRHKSYISKKAMGIIIGFGLRGYDFAIQAFL